MFSRFTPTGDSRYTPRDRDRDRDRSPPRLERRGSNQHGSPIAPRNTDNSYRPDDAPASSANPRDGPRDPPRGPRITHDGGGRGGSYSSRGRGYAARESRDNQFPRRESDRDWQRRDAFDRRSPPPRNRSRTPPGKDYRDTRDPRDLPGRELDMSRITRNVRDGGPMSATSTHSDSPFSIGGFYRGSSFRGRGRGDWDGRGRGRGGLSDDRDPFRARSRSRDRITRDFRDERGRDHERDSSRRDDDKKSEWDRDGDRYRRDPPLRPDSRNSTGSQHASATPSHASAPYQQSKPAGLIAESSRRSSFALPQARPELSRNASTPQPPSSPLTSVQVPMFGAVNPSIVAPTSKPSTAQTSPKEASPTPGRSDSADPTKVAPKAPKAELNAQPPIGPKAALGFQRRAPFPLNSPGRAYDAHYDAVAGQSPSMSRFGGPVTPSSAPLSSAPRIRAFPPWASPEMGSRPIPSEAPTSVHSYQCPDTPSSLTFANTSSRIPTGPKASQPSIRAPMNPRGSKPSTMTWVNPKLQRPSILQPLAQHAARKDDGKTARPSTSGSNREMSKGISRAFAAASSPSLEDATRLKPGFSVTGKDKPEAQVPSEATSPRAASPEDEDENAAEDDEENMDLFDQEDFEEAERQFVKEMDALRSKMVPSPTKHPTLLVLLEELDALASAAEDLENGVLPPKIEEPPTSTRPVSMPTPPNEASSIKKSEEPMQFKLEREESVIDDLPLQGLPYLANGIPTPISDVDFLDERDCEEQLCQQIKHSLAVENETDEELRQEFARLYRNWREEVELYDRERAEIEEAEERRFATPLPEGPAEPATAPSAQGDTSINKRREMYADDQDLQKILDRTKTENDMKTMQQAQDSQERADPTREASIPDMLTASEERLYLFEDVNNRVNAASTLQVFRFIPPSDDFKDEEQEHFKEAYVATPKKWGFIAQAINRAMTDTHDQRGDGEKFRHRDFHDCIRHYYLTKKESLYKNMQSKRGRKRGRGTGVRGRKPKAILGSSTLPDDSPNKVTDTGRPKRSAAPEFNSKEKKEADSMGRGSTYRARGGGGISMLNKPLAAPNESTPEKTPARRGRQPNKDKGAKRGAKPTVLAPNVSPIKKPGVAEPAPVPEPPLNEGFQQRDLETAEVLAGFGGAVTGSQQQPPVPVPQITQPEDRRVDSQSEASHVPSVAPVQALATAESLEGRPPLAPVQQTLATALPIQPQISPPQLPPEVVVAQSVPQTPVQQPQQQSMAASHTQPGVAMQAAAPAPAKQNQSSRAAGQTSSYWSVQEQQDFEALVKHYGRDWEAVGREMPLKTETMVSLNDTGRGPRFPTDGRQVKNQFMRQVQNGRPDLEEWANQADRHVQMHGQPGTLLDPTRSVSSTGATPGRRRGQTVNASQRTLAPNPEQVQAEPVQTEAQNVAIAPQISPQDRGHPRLAIAPPRQPIAPNATAAVQALVSEQAAPVSAPVSRMQPQPQPLRPANRDMAQTQSQQIQLAPAQSQQQVRGLQPSRFASDVANDNAPPVQPSSKRPRSQSEQELLDREQPPKRQGVPFDVFNNALSMQHEQKQQQQQQQQQHQHQQRPITRVEPQPPYDYRVPRQQQQPTAQQQAVIQSSIRTVSNPEDAERLGRTRPIQPSVSPREYRNHSNIQPNIQPHPPPANQQPPSQTPMQAVMQARATGASPAQRTPPEVTRPSSVPAPAVQPPFRPASQAPARVSNLMSLLNDEPSEPQARKPSTEPKPLPPPPPRHNSPLTQVPMYQTPSQASPYPLRDIMIDPVREAHQGMSSRASYAQQAYGSPAERHLSYRDPSQQQAYNVQPPHQQPPVQPQHQPPQLKETISWSSSRAYYADTIRPVEPPRLYQPPNAASPPPAPHQSAPNPSSYHPASRSTYPTPHQPHQQPPTQQPPHKPHQDGGPPHPHGPHVHSHSHSHSHARASSYSTLHPNAPGKPATGPGQALAPSPYSTIRPGNLQQPLQSHQPPPSPQHPNPSYYASAGPGPGRSAFSMGHETAMRGGHEQPGRGGPGPVGRDVVGRDEAFAGVPRRYTPTQTPPSGGGRYGGGAAGYAPPANYPTG
ncbi:MAG: hypothetical protein LQ340_002650 [Diploschistes diacapsis]|nr:MAG: hypothetical protein LQ340_002650 [Diploschistes diacapsis]